MIGSRIFGSLSKGAGKVSDAILNRFRVTLVGILVILGPVLIKGLLGVNASPDEGGSNRRVNIAGDVHIRPLPGSPDAVVLGFGEDENFDVRLTFITDPLAFMISSNHEFVLNAPGKALFLGDDVGSVRIGTGGPLVKVGVGQTGVPVAQLQIKGEIAIEDAMTAPATLIGYASIYVDSSDGDLKVKFGDGTVKRLTSDLAGQTYTPTNVGTDRSYDANSTTVDELADVLGTLIADLQTEGILN